MSQTSVNVKMSNNMQKYPKMSENVNKCPQMSVNMIKCLIISLYVLKCPKNEHKCPKRTTNVNRCYVMSDNRRNIVKCPQNTIILLNIVKFSILSFMIFLKSQNLLKNKFLFSKICLAYRRAILIWLSQRGIARLSMKTLAIGLADLCLA